MSTVTAYESMNLRERPGKMQKRNWGMLGLSVVLALNAAFVQADEIPKDQLDPKKVYWGSSASFEKAGEIDYERAIKSTRQYAEIKKKKIQRGTGKYWILLSQASDQVVRAISQVGQQTDCDLITSRGYLSSLNPPKTAEDVTQMVLANLPGGKK